MSRTASASLTRSTRGSIPGIMRRPRFELVPFSGTMKITLEDLLIWIYNNYG